MKPTLFFANIVVPVVCPMWSNERLLFVVYCSSLIGLLVQDKRPAQAVIALH
jgi:hypothetical protein